MTDKEVKDLREALTRAIVELDQVLADQDAEHLWSAALDFAIENRRAREKKERELRSAS